MKPPVQLGGRSSSRRDLGFEGRGKYLGGGGKEGGWRGDHGSVGGLGGLW